MALVSETTRTEKICFVGKACESCVWLEEVSVSAPANSFRASATAEGLDGFRVIACDRGKSHCRLFHTAIDQEKLDDLTLAGQDRILPLDQWRNYYALLWTSFDYSYLYFLTPDNRSITYVPPGQKGYNGKLQFIGNKEFTLYNRETALRETAKKMIEINAHQLDYKLSMERGQALSLESGINCISLPEDNYKFFADNSEDAGDLKSYIESNLYNEDCSVPIEPVFQISLDARPINKSNVGLSCDINQPVTEMLVQEAWEVFGNLGDSAGRPTLDQYCNLLSLWWYANQNRFLDLCVPNSQFELIDDAVPSETNDAIFYSGGRALAYFEGGDNKITFGYDTLDSLAQNEVLFTKTMHHECAHHNWANFKVRDEALEIWREAYDLTWYELVGRGYEAGDVTEKLNGDFNAWSPRSNCKELRAYLYDLKLSHGRESKYAERLWFRKQMHEMYFTFPASTMTYLLNSAQEIIALDNFLSEDENKEFAESRKMIEAYYEAEPFLTALDRPFWSLQSFVWKFDPSLHIGPSFVLKP